MILVGGENLIDLVQSSDVDGSPSFVAKAGGSQYNCAMALGRLGTKPRYITPISTDKMGDILASTLVDAGVDIVGARVDAPSSLAVVSFRDGQPSYQFYREDTAERQVTAHSLASAIPAETRVFQVGSLSLCDGSDADAWADAFVTSSQRGVLCSLDPNVRPTFIKDRARYTARIERMIAVAGLVKISDEDMAWLYPGTDLEAQSRALLATSNARVFVLTKGSGGAVLFAKDTRVEVPAQHVENLVDTVGAGDTFMAALIFGLVGLDLDLGPDQPLNASQLADIGKFAAKAAAINCTRMGCNPPTLAEIEAI